jgi:hypothetical protein
MYGALGSSYPPYSPISAPFIKNLAQFKQSLGNYVADGNHFSNIFDGFSFLDDANAKSQRGGYNYGY